MRRRTFLGLATAGSLLGSGCSGLADEQAARRTASTAGTGDSTPADSTTSDPTPTADRILDDSPGAGVRSVEFAIGVVTTAGREDPPRVTFDPVRRQVAIRGRLRVGSSRCNEVKLSTVEYDQRTGVLRVVVTPGKSGGHPEKQADGTDFCTKDVSVDTYEAVVGFRDALPERVVAEERDAEEQRRETDVRPNG